HGRHLRGADARRVDLAHLVVAGEEREHRIAAAAAGARRGPHAARQRARRAARERAASVRRAAWAHGLPLIIIFGLKLGVFTPTEAGVVAAVYALFVSTVVYRQLK